MAIVMLVAYVPAAILDCVPMMRNSAVAIGLFTVCLGCGGGHDRATTPATPSGSGTSACTIAIDVGQTRFDQNGGETTLRITASGPSCPWDVTTPEWVKLQSASSGTGSTDLRLTVSRYVLEREGTIVVAGRSAAIVQKPEGEIGALRLDARCFGPFRPGDYAGLACAVAAYDGTNPISTGKKMFADLRIFGRSAASQLGTCTACGFPTTFELDMRFPENIAPGAKTFAVWATDAEGRTATTTATLVIVPR